MRECPSLQKSYGWLILISQSMQPMNPPEHHEAESYPPLHIPIWLLVTVLGQRVGSHSQGPSHSPSIMCSDCLTQMCFTGSRDKLVACCCQRRMGTFLLLLPLLSPVLIPSPSSVILSSHQLSMLLA